MAGALQPPLLRATVGIAKTLRRRQPTASDVLTFEFLAPFYVFAATTMAIASAFTWLHGRNPILATILLGQTLFYVMGSIAAFHGRTKMRKVS